MDTFIYNSSIKSNTLNDYTSKPKKKLYHPIKKICRDNIDYIRELVSSGKARPCVLDNVEKMILCNTIYLGYDAFECPICHEENLMFRHCHSRFCSSCGVKYAKQLAASVLSFSVNVKHRHMVFTIPEELRIFFLRDRSLLNLLFIAARNTISAIVNNKIFRKLKKQARKLHRDVYNTKYLYKNFKNAIDFGMIATLHTFGRDLSFNPHIHALVPELIYDSSKDEVRLFNYFDFKKLRTTFQYELLRLMHDQIGSSFTSTKRAIYESKNNGFYVYARTEPTKDEEDDDDRNDYEDDINGCISYCMRYVGRPAMAESRITEYNEATKSVSWFYNSHYDEKRHNVTHDVRSFINKLIIHIPDDHFKMTRYYGFYANASQKKLDRIHQLWDQKVKDKHTQKQRQQLKQKYLYKCRYRTMSIDSFNRDPLKCRCGNYMVYTTTYNPLEGGHNDRAYREACINEMQAMRIRRKST